MSRIRFTKTNFVFLLLALILAAFFILREEATAPSGAQLHAFSVGQDDAFFFESRTGIRVLIDGGPSDRVVEKLGKTLPFRDRRLNYVILTHPHADHVVGLLSVLDRYQVNRLIMTGVVHTTDEYLTFLEKVKELKIPVQMIGNPQVVEDQDVRFEFLWPEESVQGKKVRDTGIEAAGGLNDTSIVTKIITEQVRFLFPGDASSFVEARLLEAEQDVGAEVVALAHHGSGTSNSEDWLRAVSPKIALVSAGTGNSYHLPNFRVVKRVERLGIPLFRTDQDGDVVVSVENGKLKVKTEKNKRLTF